MKLIRIDSDNGTFSVLVSCQAIRSGLFNHIGREAPSASMYIFHA